MRQNLLAVNVKGPVKHCTPPGVKSQNTINLDMSQEEEEDCYLFWAIIPSLIEPVVSVDACWAAPWHVDLGFLGGVALNLMLSQPCGRASQSVFNSLVSLEFGVRENTGSLHMQPCALIRCGYVRSALFF